MTVSFVSRNKNLEPLDNHDKEGEGPIGWCWSWLLDEGAGLPIGLANGDGNHGYIYAKERWPQGNMLTPYNGGGAYITAEESKMVAACIDMICVRYEFIAKEWEKLSLKEKELREQLDWMYVKPVRADYLKKGRILSEWIKKSNGFYVN